MNTQIQMLLGGVDASVGLLQSRKDEKPGITRFGSALQNPDLSRAELAALLRKGQRNRESAKARKTYWDAFLASYLTRNANTNASA